MTRTVDPRSDTPAGRPRRAPRGIALGGTLRGGVLACALAGTFTATLSLAPHAFAGDASVVDVAIQALGGGQFRVDATLLHADTGWDHYANRWDVLAEDGTLLGSRELAHPHENEQPFTRSLTLAIPDEVARVTISAVDSVHGDGGGETVEVDVPR